MKERGFLWQSPLLACGLEMGAFFTKWGWHKQEQAILLLAMPVAVRHQLLLTCSSGYRHSSVSACPLLYRCLPPALPSLVVLLGDPSFPHGSAFAGLFPRLTFLFLKSLYSKRKNNYLFHLAKLHDYKPAHQPQQGQELPVKGRRHLLLPEEQISHPLVSASLP